MGEDCTVLVVALLSVKCPLAASASGAALFCYLLKGLFIAVLTRIEKNKVVRILFLRLFCLFTGFMEARKRNLRIFLRFIPGKRTSYFNIGEFLPIL